MARAGVIRRRLVPCRYPALLHGLLLGLTLRIARSPGSAPPAWIAASFLLVAPVAVLDFDHR